MENDRIPPSDKNAEYQAIAAALMSEEKFYLVLSELSELDFFYPECSKIFVCMKKENSNDLVVIGSRLPEFAQDIAEIIENYHQVDISASIAIIRDMRQRREIIILSETTKAKAYDTSESNASEIGIYAHEKLYSISNSVEKQKYVSIGSMISPVMEHIKAIQNGHAGDIHTGLIEIDKKVYINNGDLIIIAGRPSMGKSSLADNISRHAALTENKIVVFFSLEMSKLMFSERSICSQAGVNVRELREGFLAKKKYPELSEASNVLKKANIFIDDTPGIRLSEIINVCNVINSENKIDVIFVDYLQIMGIDKAGTPREQQISGLSAGLKNIARKFNVPVIALSQLSRACELRDNKRPQLSDLRESGAIEQDADTVLFCFREDYYNETKENKGGAEIIIGKQRNGPTGIIKCLFDKYITTFKNIDNEHEETKRFQND
jgi:replicative DNA helicase